MKWMFTALLAATLFAIGMHAWTQQGDSVAEEPPTEAASPLEEIDAEPVGWVFGRWVGVTASVPSPMIGIPGGR
ncbi:MAG: hypothetical protein N2C14_20295 [Planctomycetales bacterium]